MADICSVASVCAFLKKSNTMLSDVDDVVVDDILLTSYIFLILECWICILVETGDGWKDDVDVNDAIIDMIASSAMADRFACCVDPVIFFAIVVFQVTVTEDQVKSIPKKSCYVNTVI